MSEPPRPRVINRFDFDIDRIRRLKGSASVAVVVPAKDESTTIGDVLDAVLVHADLVDELVVVNDHSRDATARVAIEHGAKVVDNEADSGKGSAMRAGFEATSSDLVVFLDGDVSNTSPQYVARLIQPLLERTSIQLVKAYYERSLHGEPTGGGRVNELVARPILANLFPGLEVLRQPLAGESALRREVAAWLTFESGYGVELGLYLDVVNEFGIESVAEVDLGVRHHRNRSLDELRPMAQEILRVALERHRLFGTISSRRQDPIPR